VTPFVFLEFTYVFVTEKDYMSEAHEDCNCSRGLEGMHVRLSKARSESFCLSRIHLRICNGKRLHERSS